MGDLTPSQLEALGQAELSSHLGKSLGPSLLGYVTRLPYPPSRVVWPEHGF